MKALRALARTLDVSVYRLEVKSQRVV